MGGGGESTRTVTQNVSEPWSGQKPYLANIYQAASDRAHVPLSYYPNSTVAGMSPDTTRGIQQNYNLATAQSPYVAGAGRLAADTYSGKYLSPDTNPYLKSTYGAAASDVTDAFNRGVMPGIAARYGLAGRTGGPDEMAAYARAQQGLSGDLSQLAANIYGGNYQAERGNQLQALGMAPGLEQSRFTAGQELERGGLLYENQAQKQLDDSVSRYEFNRDNLDLRLARYSTLVGNSVPGGGVSNSKSSGGGSDQLTQGLLSAAALATILLSA